MARLARLFLQDTPHLMQIRVLPATPVADVGVLDGWTQAFEAEWQHLRFAMHGWAITPTEILLLATPPNAAALRALVQGLGRHISRERGGGKVFDGRYHSALVEPGSWVVPALIWLENLPVRQGLAPEGEYWRWSSARAHTGFDLVNHLSMHADYWRCGNTPFDRQATWRRWLHEGLDAGSRERLTAALRGQWALGSPAFLARVHEVTGRQAAPRPRGRPRRLTAPSRPQSP